MASKEALIFVVILLIISTIFYTIFNSNMLPQGQMLGIILAAVLLFIFLPRVYEFKEYERAVVLRLGKYDRTVGPGWIIIFPVFERFIPVDLRVKTLDTQPQMAQTRDDVRVKIDIVTFIRIVNPKKAILEVKELNTAIVKLIIGEIRLMVGKLDLDEVIEQTEEINEHLLGKLKEVEDAWGFVVLRVELESIELPPVLVEARTRARAAQQYKQRVEIEASARQVALEILDKAASKMSDKTMTYLYLDVLKKISEGRASKIIFPLELSRLASTIAEGTSGGKKEQKMKYEEILEELKAAYIEKQKNALEKEGENK